MGKSGFEAVTGSSERLQSRQGTGRPRFTSVVLLIARRMGIMFRGINTATLDGKGRMALPTRFREPLMVAADGKLVITIDMREQCLLLYPLPEWEVVQRKLEGLSNIAENARRLQRLLIGHATDIDMDGQGRILLTGMLRDFAGLEKKLVLVGQGNKLEIWSAAQWQERMSSWLSEESELRTDGDEFTGLSV